MVASIKIPTDPIITSDTFDFMGSSSASGDGDFVWIEFVLELITISLGKNELDFRGHFRV